jgi:hypothetical protein
LCSFVVVVRLRRTHRAAAPVARHFGYLTG